MDGYTINMSQEKKNLVHSIKDMVSWFPYKWEMCNFVIFTRFL